MLYVGCFRLCVGCLLFVLGYVSVIFRLCPLIYINEYGNITFRAKILVFTLFLCPVSVFRLRSANYFVILWRCSGRNPGNIRKR